MQTSAERSQAEAEEAVEEEAMEEEVAGGEAAEEGTRKGTQITHVDTLLRTPAPRIDAASKNISVLRYRNELIPSSTHSRPAAIKCQPLTLPLPLHLHLPSPSPIPFQLSICYGRSNKK